MIQEEENYQKHTIPIPKLIQSKPILLQLQVSQLEYIYMLKS